MKIQSAPPALPVRSTAAPVPAPPPAPSAPLPEDGVDLAASKTAGAVGAMAGALSGRVLASAAGAAAGAAVGSLIGPWGAAVGAGLGLYGGIKLELKTKAGRLVGGMVGGAIGAGAGAVAGKLGWQPSETMARETRGFSLEALPGRLLNPHYTSHPLLSPEIAAEGMKHVQPGDVIITNDDGNFMLEILQKLMGCTSDWTHNYLVDKDNTVMDILLTENKPTRWPLEHAFTDNCHAMVLRPAYANAETREAAMAVARSKFDKMTYDFKFDLSTDDAMYCQEYTYKAIKEGAPEVRLEPKKHFFKSFMSADEFQSSPDMKEVWSTGSNFWLNWLSHFD